MRIFFNFFIKIIAFLSAITVFIVILSLLISLSKNRFNENIFSYKEGNINSDNKIALLKLKGPILNEPRKEVEFGFLYNYEIIYVSEVKKLLKELELEKIKGLIVSINSPGGSVSAAHNLYHILNDYKNNNDVKIFFHTSELLASGGYWVALASDKIYANYGSLIGSIGVRGPDWIYFDTPIAISKGLLGESITTEKGIKTFNTIAGQSKDLFNSFRIPTEKEYSALQDIVNNIYKDFVNLVSKNRNIENDFIIDDLGALIFDAENAKENYLIDGVINLSSATNKLITTLSLKDYQIIEQRRDKYSFFQNLIQTNSIFNNDIVNSTKQEICNIMNNYISVIFIQNYLDNSC